LTKETNSKREDIIQAALQLFIQQGYEQTTITQIMKAANVSKGGMYHHFESKEEILDVVIHHLIDEDMKRYSAMIANEEMTAIEKFNALFTLNDNRPQHVVEAMEYTIRHPNSLFDYRTRELSKERSIPCLVEIIQQGIDEGLFQTEYPMELGEFCYVISQSVFENMPQGINKTDMERRIDAFLFVMSKSLSIQVEMLQPAKESLMQQVNQAGGQ